MFAFQTAEQAGCYNQCSDGQNHLSGKLGIGQTVQREQPVEDAQGRDFQHDFAQDGKQQRFASHADRLKDTNCQKIQRQEGQSQREAAQEVGTIGDDRLVLHEQRNKGGWEQLEEQRHRDDDGERSLARKADRLFHTADVAAGVVIADQRHNSLGDSHRDLHGHHVDLLGDAHGGHGVGAVGGRKVVQDCHAGHVQQVLDRRGDAHGAHPGHHVALQAEIPGGE